MLLCDEEKVVHVGQDAYSRRRDLEWAMGDMQTYEVGRVQDGFRWSSLGFGGY